MSASTLVSGADRTVEKFTVTLLLLTHVWHVSGTAILHVVRDGASDAWQYPVSGGEVASPRVHVPLQGSWAFGLLGAAGQTCPSPGHDKQGLPSDKHDTKGL